MLAHSLLREVKQEEKKQSAIQQAKRMSQFAMDKKLKGEAEMPQRAEEPQHEPLKQPLERKVSLTDAANQLRRTMFSRHTVNIEDVLNCAQEILEDLNLSMLEIVPLIWTAFIGRASHYRSAIEKYAGLLQACVELLVPYDAALLFLGCVEATLDQIDEVMVEGAINVVPRILKSLRDQNIIDSETIIGWLEGSVPAVHTETMKPKISSEVKQKVRGRCQLLIEWLDSEAENGRILPKNLSLLETLAFEYVKLDLVKPGPIKVLPPKTPYAASEWSEIEESSIGNDWMFLEDAI